MTADFETPKNLCPRCGYASDRATPTDGDEKPVPNDVAICLGCGGLNCFDETLHLRAMDDEEFATLPADQRAAIEDALAAYKRTFPNGLPKAKEPVH